MPAGLGLNVARPARLILDTLVAHYDAAVGISLPDRRLIAPGAPELIAWDCEMAVVTCSGVNPGPAPGVGGLPQRTGRPISSTGVRHAIYAVQIVRSSPEASQGGRRPPGAARLTDAGADFMRDIGLLSQVLIDVCTAMDEEYVGFADAGAVQVLGPEGGYVAAQGALAVTVGDLV